MTVDRVPDHMQAGWNLGYLAGEAERVALACANADLRSDLIDAQRTIDLLLEELDDLRRGVS